MFMINTQSLVNIYFDHFYRISMYMEYSTLLLSRIKTNRACFKEKIRVKRNSKKLDQYHREYACYK